MRIALILTGALRTIQQTMPYLLKNIIYQNHQVDVFACVQNDKAEGNFIWERYLLEQLGDSLKSVQWLDEETYACWSKHRAQLLKNMSISENIKFYLENSGSIIEYYQLQLAYIQMTGFEFENNVTYDYIIRARTDTIFTRAVNFEWLNWTEEHVAARLERLQEYGRGSVSDFMTTLLYDIDDVPDELIGVSEMRENVNSGDLCEYVRSGRYILTFRKNLLYIVKRDFFYFVPSLGTMYGTYMTRGIEPDFRWNAESQFRAACLLSGLSIFDYSTAREELSLYQYNPKNYFNSDGNLLDNKMLYCLIRF